MKARSYLSLFPAAAMLCMALAAPAFAAPAQKPPVDPQVPAAPQTMGADAPMSASVHALDATDLSAWLDGRVPYALKSGEIAGLVISVVKDGKVLLQKGYGLADVEAAVPMDPATTLVRPGSTSKLFTWTAVMQLVQQGKLDLDRNVNDYLDFKIAEPFGKPVTMRHLMNHRAGFEEGLKDLLGYDPGKPRPRSAT
jgi:CubicO group peptidase (beta-lactamase class C family)